MHQSPAASSRSYRMVGHKGSPPRHRHVPGVLAVQDGDVPQGWHGMASRAVPVLNGKEQVCVLSRCVCRQKCAAVRREQEAEASAQRERGRR